MAGTGSFVQTIDGSRSMAAVNCLGLRSINDIPRQQRFELLDGIGVGKLREKARKIGVRLNTIGFCGLDERVQVGACAGAGLGIGE